MGAPQGQERHRAKERCERTKETGNKEKIVELRDIALQALKQK